MKVVLVGQFAQVEGQKDSQPCLVLQALQGEDNGEQTDYGVACGDVLDCPQSVDRELAEVRHVGRD